MFHAPRDFMYCDLEKRQDNNISGYLFERAFVQKRPIACSLALTPYCNLGCSLCGYTLKKNDNLANSLLSYDDWIRLARQMREAGVLSLTLTGGEPTSVSYFSDLYVELIKLGFLLKLKTNATLITKPDIECLLRKYPPRATFLTIYGGSSDTYDLITGNGDSYNRMLDGLAYLVNLPTELYVTMTITKQNMWDVKTVANIAKSYSRRLMVNTCLHPHAETGSIHCMEHALTPSERVVIEHITNFSNMRDAENTIKKMDELLHNFRLEDFYDDTKPNENEYQSCLNSLQGCCINFDGRMLYCQSSRQYYATPLVDGFENSWLIMQENIATNFLSSPKCNRCKLRKFCHNSCPSMRYLYTHSLQEPHSKMCDYAYLSKEYNNIGRNG